jgi:hypothetical protein
VTTSPERTPAPADPILTREQRDRVREGVTMALYISLSLLAVMIALPLGREGSREGVIPDAALIVAVSSIGLIVAHLAAFHLSSRLVDRGAVSAEHVELVGAQIVGGVAVTVLAVVPIVLIEGRTGIRVAEFLLIGFIALVGYATARSANRSRVRSVAYVGIVILASLVVLGIKGLVDH